ncbi:MAG TPA: hypothetical protein PLS67_10515, partial [Accumulibacter sp.]|nr:hypothetical protein [Accumulibacter sp.]
MGHAEIPAQNDSRQPALPSRRVTGRTAATKRRNRRLRGATMQKIEAVNDFVVKFANINGSGSASANELLARAILRMGVPVSPRNIFPSNI